MKYLVAILTIVAIFIVCKKESTAPEDILLLSDSFEIQGSGSHQGWIVDPSLTDFMDDTPDGGGIWSLELMAGNTSEGYAIKEINPSYGDGIYRLSVWGKMSHNQPSGTGYIRLGVVGIGDASTQTETVFLEDTSWTQYVIVDTLTFDSQEDILIRLSSGAADSTGAWYSLFDLVRLEKLAE